MSDEKEFLIAELRRELEHVGLSPTEAQAVAASRIDDSATSQPDDKPRQHVVPVASGWLVIRDLPNIDIGLFEGKEAAIEAARDLASASGGQVIVHDD